MTTTDYSTAAYPHSSHRRYVRGCQECLARTKASQARYTASQRRNSPYCVVCRARTSHQLNEFCDACTQARTSGEGQAV